MCCPTTLKTSTGVKKKLAGLIDLDFPRFSAKALCKWSILYIFLATLFYQVLFPYDAVYLVLMILFSVSTGYIGTICMMFAPKVLPEGEAQVS